MPVGRHAVAAKPLACEPFDRAHQILEYRRKGLGADTAVSNPGRRVIVVEAGELPATQRVNGSQQLSLGFAVRPGGWNERHYLFDELQRVEKYMRRTVRVVGF
jgi:hypothetical protein